MIGSALYGWLVILNWIADERTQIDARYSWFPGPSPQSELFAADPALRRRTHAGNCRRGVYQHFAPISCWLLGVLAIAIGVVCVATEWPNLDDRKARVRLMWTQALHWATFLVIMNIMLLPHVHSMVPAPANSLVLLMLLALGTILAGINLLSLQICFLGLAMAISVPAIAWFKQSALFCSWPLCFSSGSASPSGHAGAKSIPPDRVRAERR